MRKRGGEFRACKLVDRIGKFPLCCSITLPLSPRPSPPVIYSIILSFLCSLFLRRESVCARMCVCVFVLVRFSPARSQLKHRLSHEHESQSSGVCVLNVCVCVRVCACMCFLNTPFSVLPPENKNNSCERNNT